MSEYLQFVALMVVFVTISSGSYWFILYSPGPPSRGQRVQQSERERHADYKDGGR